MSRHAALRLALALALPACGLLADPGDAETETETSAEAAGEQGLPTTGGPASGCILDAADCPSPALCEQVECLEQRCVYTPIAADAHDDDTPGDCRRHVCDGAGGSAPVADDTDLPDDANACTLDQCTALGPENLPREPGSACDDGGYCHADLHCRDCPERDTCVDDSAAEPNESQSAARQRPKITDADDPDHACEALGSPGDVDWFRLEAVDLAIGKVAPTFTLSPPELQLCVYFQCKQGGTTVTCPEGSVAANAPLGQLGCCGVTAIAPQIDCKDFNEDATLWLAVRHDPGGSGEPPEPPACLAYQLDYAY